MMASPLFKLLYIFIAALSTGNSIHILDAIEVSQIPDVVFAPVMFEIPTNYSAHKSPPLLGPQKEPIPVELTILIFNVFDIKEMIGEISLEVNYKVYWKDSRLSHWANYIDPEQEFAPLDMSLLKSIWKPDIFIDHTQKVVLPQLLSPASSLRIYSDGSLRYSARMLIVVSCQMSFYHYPADTQECNFTFKSYGYSTSYIDLKWDQKSSVAFAFPIKLTNFDLALRVQPNFIQETKTNNYTALKFGLKLRRQLSYHIFQTYIPSTLLVVVSWLSFLLPTDSVPGRMAICATTMLTVISMFGSIKGNTPHVSYIRAIDTWMFLCIVFIFLSLAEFTFVLKLKSMRDKKEEQRRSIRNNDLIGEESRKKMQNVGLSEQPSLLTKYHRIALKFEKYFPRIVPILFLIFTLIYWPYLIVVSDYFGLRTSEEMFYKV